MCCTIRFIGCHPVSPQEEKRGPKNGKIKGENMEKAPEPKGGRENVRMAARKQGKTAENHMGGMKPAKEKL